MALLAALQLQSLLVKVGVRLNSEVLAVAHKLILDKQVVCIVLLDKLED
jgi:hypothetical protein